MSMILCKECPNCGCPTEYSKVDDKIFIKLQ